MIRNKPVTIWCGMQQDLHAFGLVCALVVSPDFWEEEKRGKLREMRVRIFKGGDCAITSIEKSIEDLKQGISI